jgi:hypothetical protein
MEGRFTPPSGPAGKPFTQIGYAVLNSLVLLVCCGCIVVSAQSVWAQTSTPTVTVRVYNTYGVGRADTQAGQATAESILRDARVAIEWRECRTPKGPSAKALDPCSDVLSATEVIMRIVRSPRGTSPESFGFSYVDHMSGIGSLATVFGDRVSATAKELRISGGTLLGRVIAHELGHLLLGTTAHSANGLMRSHWSERLLRVNVPNDWKFSSDEVRMMRTTIEARASMTGPVDQLARRRGEPLIR